jgi:signal transduction histidine kinase
MSVEIARRHPLFAGLSESDLGHLLEHSSRRALTPGEVLMAEGGRSQTMFLILDGEFEILKRSGDQEVRLATRGSGEVLGEMALLDDAPHSATVRAASAATVLPIESQAFHHLISTSPEAALAILHTVTERLRHTEAMLRQSEKMAALGTMAAGLAHELNNPASAARRSSEQLSEALVAWRQLALGLSRQAIPPDQLTELERLSSLTFGAVPSAPLDPLEASDRETEMEAWLASIGVDEPWTVAPPLVASGLRRTALQAATERFPAEARRLVPGWLATGGVLSQLVYELGNSAARISEIVSAVKSYSYLDRAPVQNVDIHRGLEDSLLLLRHKLGSGVSVKKKYGADVPIIEAYASELNQVWTNLLDNAIDAMQGSGEISIRTYREAEQVVVEIHDQGAGIPPEVQGRIFEPFFTTKPPGSGTGLGLHISQEIVAGRHGGDLRVRSEPGDTTFSVRLPLRLPRRNE